MRDQDKSDGGRDLPLVIGFVFFKDHKARGDHVNDIELRSPHTIVRRVNWFIRGDRDIRVMKPMMICMLLVGAWWVGLPKRFQFSLDSGRGVEWELVAGLHRSPVPLLDLVWKRCGLSERQAIEQRLDLVRNWIVDELLVGDLANKRMTLRTVCECAG